MALIKRWEEYWQTNADGARSRRTRAVEEPANSPVFGEEVLDKFRRLRKHESSLLVQIRTGKVGLKGFLFERNVPEVWSPRYSYGLV